jgi:hypothetical protein
MILILTKADLNKDAQDKPFRRVMSTDIAKDKTPYEMATLVIYMDADMSRFRVLKSNYLLISDSLIIEGECLKDLMTMHHLKRT